MHFRFFFRHTLRAATLFACTLFATSSVAQKVDAEFLRAISTIYAGGFTGQIVKEWCDERAPNLATQNAKALEAWRIKMDLPMVDARLVGLIGVDGKDKIAASFEDKRSAFYDQLDNSGGNPETECAGLGKALNDDFNLKVLYANEYKILATNPAGTGTGGNSGSSSGGTAGKDTGKTPVTTNPSTTGPSTTNPSTTNPSTTGPSTTVSKLPVLPAFDYAQFAKLKLNPEKEPIPDEYHCYAEIRGEKYASHQLTLQILPGRKYRVGIGTSVSEGSFKMDGYDLFITSGAFASKRKHYYTFNRSNGAQIWLYDLGSEENQIDFRCFQRGGSEQIQQLNFKRKDPQVGAYTCVATDGSGQVMPSKLEILPNRRYRYNNSEGTYKPDITGDFSDDYSDVRFTGGQFDDSYAFYEEGETGQQKYDFGGGIKLDCLRQVTPRPNPKFGAAKAPAAPGTGGLEGRYFYGRPQFVDIYNNLPCQGMCYSYLVFQKNGYVYSDDLEDTEGLEDADCTRTYPSGIPVCETYTAKGNMLQIGIEKPEVFSKTKTGMKIDGDDWDVLEPLDGLKFNLAYYTQRISGAVVGTGGSSSSTNLALRKDGRFTRESSSSFFFGATDTGTAQGNVTAGVSGSNSRSNGGTYRVYGNTIELKYDDGRIVKLFMFLPSGRKDQTFLHIGGSIYWEDKPKK